jgi:hypothetical protein
MIYVTDNFQLGTQRIVMGIADLLQLKTTAYEG